MLYQALIRCDINIGITEEIVTTGYSKPVVGQVEVVDVIKHIG